MYTIITFYRFVNLLDCNVTTEQLRVIILSKCIELNIKGTILLANEGINATIVSKMDNACVCAGATSPDIPENLALFIKFLTSGKEFEGKFANIAFNKTYSSFPPFHKMKVKYKPEVIRFNNNIDTDKTTEYIDYNQKNINNVVGKHLDSSEWDEILSDDDALVIDTRNYYEITFGKFKNAVNPNINNFTNLEDWLNINLKNYDKDKKIAMYCTGGIRCEKSTAYVKKMGFENVYQLKGGILRYLQDKKNLKDNNTTDNINNDIIDNDIIDMWDGKLFLFDDRICIDKDLKSINEN